MISKPNNWTKTVAKAANRISQANVSETKELQYRYWEQLGFYLQEQGSKLRPQTPRPKHWHNFSIGRSGLTIAATTNTRESLIGVQLYLSHPDNSKAFFHLLKRDKAQIEQDLGKELEWQELPEKTASRIVVFKSANPTDESDWDNQHEWLKETIEAFDRVFRKRVRKLAPEQWKPEEKAA